MVRSKSVDCTSHIRGGGCKKRKPNGRKYRICNPKTCSGFVDKNDKVEE